MTDVRDPLDGTNDGQPPQTAQPLRQLDAPLVAAVEPAEGPCSDPATGRNQPAPALASAALPTPMPLDIDRQLHGSRESLDPTELRRAALLRLIGLGRFATRTKSP